MKELQPDTISSVAFVITEAKVESCGVTDYSIRMAALIAIKGIKTTVITTGGNSSPFMVKTTEGTVSIEPLAAGNALNYQVLALQYVPSSICHDWIFIRAIKKLQHPHIHLMIHECWRFPTLDHALTLRERFAALRQRLQLYAMLRMIHPASIGTSNHFYAEILRNAGIDAAVSPMPGNISISQDESPPPELQIPPFISQRDGTFLWVIFGSLYAAYWDSNAYFAEIRQMEIHNPRKHFWVICGKQRSADIDRLSKAAATHGLEGRLHFTGPLPARSVDWLLRQADATLTGTAFDFWEKSGGVLAAVERGIPVYFPRGKNSLPYHEKQMFTSLSDLELSSYGRDSENRNYNGIHSPAKVADHFLNIIR